MKILLVEPDFPISKKSRNHKNFLPIGLLKIGAYLQKKKKIKRILLVRGNLNEIPFIPDEIWITSLFTYWSEYFWQTVAFYRKKYPNSKIKVGGIYVSLHYTQSDFKERCKQNRIDPHFGIYHPAEKYLPDYSLLNLDAGKLDYQILHSTRGCPRHCNFCFTWKLEPKFISKKSIKRELCSHKLIFYDNNILNNKYIKTLLNELSEIKYENHHIVCESQCGFDGRIIEKQPELAKALKKARFQNPKIAWDGKYSNWRQIQKQIILLNAAGYHSKEISVFMIFNWDISYYEMKKKRKKCWEWKVQITDCRYRPITQLHDKYNARLSQTKNEYYIHPKWSDRKIKKFRSEVRRQNICVRHGFPFHSKRLENMSVRKEESKILRKMPREKVIKIVPDAWYPGD